MSKRQIPRGPEDLKCPLHQKAMEEVCHTCPWWQQIRGKHPQSLEDLDRWDCAIALLPLLLIENSQRQMQTAASVDKVANEVRKTDDAARVAMVNLLNTALAVPRQIANGNGAQPLMIEQD
jgi:hypothetical protein